MSEPREEHLRDWLSFAEELGLTPFYRRRAAPQGSPLPARKVSLPVNEDPTPAAPMVSMAHETPQTASLFGEAPGHVEGDTLEKIRADIGDCRRCKLWPHRANIVFGVGNPRAELVFVGEGPGADEDAQGEPFVGRAGRLLNRWIESMGLTRDAVYICNVVKCRPPANRTPEKDEVETCSPFLFRQLDAIRPKLICCLGGSAAKVLLGKTISITRVRGQVFDYRGSKLFLTYHPAYLLRPHSPAVDSEIRQDLEKIRTFLSA